MRRKLDIEKLKLIPKMLDEEMSYTQIGEALGVSPSAVYYWVRRMKNAHVRLNVTKGRRPINLKELNS